MSSPFLQYHPAARVVIPAKAKVAKAPRTPVCGFPEHGFCSHACEACDRRLSLRQVRLAQDEAARVIARTAPLMRAPKGR